MAGDQSNTFYNLENDNVRDIEADGCEESQNVFSPEGLFLVDDNSRVEKWPLTFPNTTAANIVGKKVSSEIRQESDEKKNVKEKGICIEPEHQYPVPKPSTIVINKEKQYNVDNVKVFSVRSPDRNTSFQNRNVMSSNISRETVSETSVNICRNSEIVKRKSLASKAISITEKSNKDVYSLLSRKWNIPIISKIRSFCDVRDDVNNQEIDKVAVTVGSLAEGLYLPDTIFDVIFILKWIYVAFIRHSEETQYLGNAVLLMEISEIRHGRVLLQVIKGFEFELISHCCLENNNVVYFSGHLFQMYMMEQNQSTMHSDFRMVDSRGSFTFTFVLKCTWPADLLKSFPRKVKSGWPSEELVSQIKEEGLILVPEGKCKDNDSQLHWKMLFTLAEKRLVRSFSHHQLLTLALLKMLVHEKLADNPTFTNLSLSYAVKVVMFWQVEEAEESMWTHGIFLENVLLCLKRFWDHLYSGCIPNYFIPEQNILENVDISSMTKLKMAELLPTENDIRLIILQKYPYFDKSSDSLTISGFPYAGNSIHCLMPLLQIASSSISTKYLLFQNIFKVLNKLNHPFIQRLYLYHMAQGCQVASQLVSLPKGGNKSIYKLLRYRLSLLLIGTHTDLVSGWTLLAFHLFKTNRFRSCLTVLDHIQQRQTDNITTQSGAYQGQRSITECTVPLLRHINRLGIQTVLGIEGSGLIPKECVAGYSDVYHFSSDIMCYYLKFLCMIETRNSAMCPEILIRAREMADTSIEKQETSGYVLDHMGILLKEHSHDL